MLLSSLLNRRLKKEESAEAVEEEVEQVVQADIEDFEKLFSSASSGMNAEQLDSFWEESAKVENMGSANPDVLSFEEASQLGLTPDELE